MNPCTPVTSCVLLCPMTSRSTFTPTDLEGIILEITTQFIKGTKTHSKETINGIDLKYGGSAPLPDILENIKIINFYSNKIKKSKAVMFLHMDVKSLTLLQTGLSCTKTTFCPFLAVKESTCATALRVSLTFGIA